MHIYSILPCRYCHGYVPRCIRRPLAAHSVRQASVERVVVVLGPDIQPLRQQAQFRRAEQSGVIHRVAGPGTTTPPSSVQFSGSGAPRQGHNCRPRNRQKPRWQTGAAGLHPRRQGHGLGNPSVLPVGIGPGAGPLPVGGRTAVVQPLLVVRVQQFAVGTVVIGVDIGGLGAEVELPGGTAVPAPLLWQPTQLETGLPALSGTASRSRSQITWIWSM